MLVNLISQVNAVGRFRKQVDGRRAKQGKGLAANISFELRLIAIEQHEHVDQLVRRATDGGRQSRQLEKQIPLRASKILGEQAVSLERARPVRQERIFVVEA